eukprot:14366083-Alexandrium_andersonii.AAC.1
MAPWRSTTPVCQCASVGATTEAMPRRLRQAVKAAPTNSPPLSVRTCRGKPAHWHHCSQNVVAT